MQYWYLRVAPHKGCEYDVYYKTPIKILKINVLRHAVEDGDLLDVSLPHVDIVEEISQEAYYEKMYD